MMARRRNSRFGLPAAPLLLALTMAAGAALAQDPISSEALHNAASQAPPDYGAVAVLKALDKVTSRVTTLEAPAGKPVRFGTLEITAMTCHKRPPVEPPETTAFLEIDDYQTDGAKKRVFSGWMFASSPGISALEHPVYDIWVIDCKTASPDKPGGRE